MSWVTGGTLGNINHEANTGNGLPAQHSHWPPPLTQRPVSRTMSEALGIDTLSWIPATLAAVAYMYPVAHHQLSCAAEYSTILVDNDIPRR